MQESQFDQSRDQEKQNVDALLAHAIQNNFNADDMEVAYVAAMGHKDVDEPLGELTAQMTKLLDNGFAANNMAKIISEKREMEQTKKYIKNDYQERLSKLNFDSESMKVLNNLILKREKGDYVIKVNGGIIYEISIDDDSTNSISTDVINKLSSVLEKLEQMGNNFKLQAEFYEKN